MFRSCPKPPLAARIAGSFGNFPGFSDIFLAQTPNSPKLHHQRPILNRSPAPDKGGGGAFCGFPLTALSVATMAFIFTSSASRQPCRRGPGQRLLGFELPTKYRSPRFRHLHRHVIFVTRTRPGLPSAMIARVGIFPVVPDDGRPLLDGFEMSAFLDAEIRVQEWTG